MTQQVLWTLVVRFLIIAAGFFSSIITARFLGPEGRGVFFYWSTLAALAIQFGNLGLHSSNTYLLAKGHAKLSALAANSLWVSLIAGGVLAGGMVLTFWFMDGGLQNRWSVLLPAILMIPSGIYFLLGTNLLVAYGCIGAFNGYELANRFLGLAALFVAACFWRTPQALLLAMSIFGVLICLLLYRHLQLLDGYGRGSMHLIRTGLSYALRAYVASAIAFAVLRLNALLIDQYMDAETLGIWSISAQLHDVIIVIPSSIALVLLPRIMRSDQPYQLMQSQLRSVALAMTLVCAVVAWLGHDVIILIYGEGFTDAYAMLLWGLPGALALGMTSILSQYLASAGMPLALVWIWLMGLVVELALGLWLIPGHGGAGAMASLSAAYLIILASVWWLAVSRYRVKV